MKTKKYKITDEYVLKRLEDFPFWYHKIRLTDGVVTPGKEFDALWNNIRETRSFINYHDKRVLDIATWDGMWAFEAEDLDASLVVAIDCRYQSFRNFLFCREIKKSSVMPFFNISAYNLKERLDVYFQEDFITTIEGATADDVGMRAFDIVQHLGLLYHVRDPMLSLAQCRSVMKAGSLLLLETAIDVTGDEAYMRFNGVPPHHGRIYDDITTWWAPTAKCLYEMLRACLFEPLEHTCRQLRSDGEIGRLAIVSRAMSENELPEAYIKELLRTYRNPGLDLRIND